MKKWILFWLSCYALQSIFAGTTDTSVQQFRGNGSHSGNYPSPASFNGVERSWTFNTHSAIRATPLAADGKLYVGCTDSNFYCIAGNGSLAWKFKADAAINSSAAFDHHTLFFISRKNTLYAIDRSGRLMWNRTLGTDLPYDWGFDYYSSSPLAQGENVYVGSGDGNVYAISQSTGKIIWKFNTDSRIRSTPAIDGGNIYVGNCNASFFCLDKNSGKKKWEFKINGDTAVNEKYGFDRKAIIASPAISRGKVIFGARDGFLYALDVNDGKKIWQSDYNTSWIISSVAIFDSVVVTGTSANQYVNALSLSTGRELWRYQGGGPVWSSSCISGMKVMNGCNDGIVSCLDLLSGKELWWYKTAGRIFSSPVISGSNLYIANDYGQLICLQSKNNSFPDTIHRAVYWVEDSLKQFSRFGLDQMVRDYFSTYRYRVVGDSLLEDFLKSRINDHQRSVLVFASNYFPSGIIGDTSAGNLLLNYLKSGGKVVITGVNPAILKYDPVTRKFAGADFGLAEKMLEIRYTHNDTRTAGGFYASFPTAEGKNWGLETPQVSVYDMPPDNISTVLSRDEVNNAGFWVKNYGGRPGTGFVQTLITAYNASAINELFQIAEYGLTN